MSKKMALTLVNGGLEKLAVAGVFLQGAMAQDMEVDVYLLLGGAYAFRKKVAETYDDVIGFDKDELISGMKKLNMPHWLKVFRDAKEMGGVKIHLCSTAAKIWGSSDLNDFVDIVDDFVGIVEAIDGAEAADVSYLL